MKLLAEALQVIESLQKPILSPIIPKASHAEDTTTMTKILQEIQAIKTTITINQKSTRGHEQSWAKIASQSEMVSQ